MKRTNRLIAAAMAGLMASTSLGALAANAQAADATAQQKAPEKAAYTTQKQLLKTADEALETVTNVHQARMALFEDETDLAQKHIGAAIKALTAGETDLKQLLIADTDKRDAKPEYLPFDMSMMLTDRFEATAEKKAALEKAGGLMKSGEQDAAIEVLRLASVDLDISAALLPQDVSMTHLKAAADMVKSGRYFEANRELKAIEDSIVVRTFGIDAIPVQGDASKTSAG